MTDIETGPVDGGSIPPHAAFVAAAAGSEYYWVGNTDWYSIPPLDRVWFPTEAAAREAGYRASSVTFERLEEFELLGEIGRGGTSIVYHARDRALGRDVAIKVIQACFLEDAESLARFAQEARLLAGLRHPNVVSAFAVKQLRGGGLALVMEYVRGPTLRDVLRANGALGVPHAEHILREIGGALAAAHRAGIVHRDVKPDNIFVEEASERNLLADFGIATHLDNPSGLTIAGTAVGTPNYMSPEQIDGAPLDGRSDLYSLGLIGWEMLAGVKPWAGESLYSVIYKQKHDVLPSLREMRSEVPLRVQFAIEGALAKDPTARWDSVEDFLTALSDESLGARWRRWSATNQRKKGNRDTAPDLAGMALPPGDPAEVMNTVRLDQDPAGEAERRQTAVASPVVASGAAQEVSGWRWRKPAIAAGLIALTFAGIGLSRDLGAPDPAGSSSAAESVGAVALGRGEPRAPGPAPGSGGVGMSGSDPVDDLEGMDSTEIDLDALPSPEEVEEEVSGEGEVEAESATEGVRPGESLTAPLSIERSRSRVAAGGIHSCGIEPGGALVCWGGNDSGQLGAEGLSATNAVAVRNVNNVTAVEAGAFHTCALDANGAAYCWGDNREGQLGERSGDPRNPAPPANMRFFSLTLGSGHTCGMGADGSAYCWGSNAFGQLGDGSRSSRSAPRGVAAGVELVAVSAGWNHNCGLTRQGQAICWGRNDGGQLGDGSATDRPAPVAVQGGARFVALTAGSAHTCGLSSAGVASCWGQNVDGRLGDGTTAQRRQPTPVQGSSRFVEISAGGRHTCGLTSAGIALCWGYNSYGQLGTGDMTNRTAPARVFTDIVFTSIRSSGSHTCGTATDGSTYCWGYNVEGQIGDGTRSHRTVPYRVERSAA